jgi:transposase InsO family protein
MGKRIALLDTARNLVGGVFGVLSYMVRFAWLMLLPKAMLAAKLLALESQLAACLDAVNRKKAPRPRFTVSFRVLWIALSMWLPEWRKLAHVMQPDTVVGWHRRIAKLIWRWKSRPGRPAVSREMQALIRRLSRENPLWGAERIREELAKLKYDPPCEDSVRKYMVKPERPNKPSGTWLPFLRNHLDVAWAMDFFTVTTLTFQTVYVFVILEHGRRKVRHWAVTRNPTMQWVIQQLRNAMPFGEQPRFLHRDNDDIYGHGVPAFLERCGIEEVPTAFHCPWQNPYVERFIGTLRRELLDHVIPLSRGHLERLLQEFIEDYYQTERPHQGLGGETPVPSEVPGVSGPTRLVSTPVLGGLHHAYRRVAA